VDGGADAESLAAGSDSSDAETHTVTPGGGRGSYQHQTCLWLGKATEKPPAAGFFQGGG
jgi:hypothetical protein